MVPRVMPLGNCPVCQCDQATELFTRSDKYLGVAGLYSYYKCPDCYTVYQDPQVIQSDIKLCYPDNYYTHKSNSISTHTAGNPLRERRNRIRQAVISSVQGKKPRGVLDWTGWLLAFNKSIRERAFFGLMEELFLVNPDRGRSLEIGCGAGNLMLTMKQAGWGVEGLEADSSAASVARSRTGCPVYEGDFQQINLPSQTYDLIVLHHVFEHLSNPVTAFQRFTDLLAVGGSLVLVYPNPQSLGTRIFGGDWYPWDAPRHLVFPTATGLKKVADITQLSVVRERYSARFAAQYFAVSRYSKNWQLLTEDDFKIGWQDYFLSGVERVLITLGLHVGEEIILVLKKKAFC